MEAQLKQSSLGISMIEVLGVPPNVLQMTFLIFLNQKCDFPLKKWKETNAKKYELHKVATYSIK